MAANNSLKNNENEYDLLIVGGGLAGLLLAYGYRRSHPDHQVLILEEQSELSGNRTWSFHEADIKGLEILRDFIDHQWVGYEVHFTKNRRFSSRYYSVLASRFFEKMQQHLQASLLMGTKVEQVFAERVVTREGLTFRGKIVVDARSVNLRPEEFQGGFQKFLGLEIELEKPHGLQQPLLMDATVPQTDGYRFFYLLPFTETSLLIEDTYYSNTPSLDEAQSEKEMLAYIEKRNWMVKRILRTERGSLPIPTTSPFAQAVKNFEKTEGAISIGGGAGFYHPVTGYSIRWAALLAERLSAVSSPSATSFRDIVNTLKDDMRKNEFFYLLLNRLMFYGSGTHNRRRIFERFYRLPVSLIERFYSGQTTFIDAARILIGKPPIPVKDAVQAILRKETVLISNRGGNSL